MLLSMTGYGAATYRSDDLTVNVEIKSLNSKLLDIRIRSNVPLGDKEMTLRKLISERLLKGKIDVTIGVENLRTSPDSVINVRLFKKYYHSLTRLIDQLSIPPTDLMPAILRIPAVLEQTGSAVTDEEWAHIQDTFDQAVAQLIAFRRTEGQSIRDDFDRSVHNILGLLDQIPQHEAPRATRMRARLRTLLDEYLGSENVDANRFEQEIIYFLDKIDISEEKTRLRSHCGQFLMKMEEPQQRKGKVLGFISQEMGREINTLGAKANSAELQNIIVRMKEELEKIKEQILNTL